MSSRPALLFYCQHSLGMGHLMRSLALTRALSPRFDVTFVSGGALPHQVRLGAEVKTVQLPPVGLDKSGRMVSRDRRRSLERALAERRRVLLDTYRSVRPRVLMIELFPFGRRKFLAELEPIVELAHDVDSDTLVCCSLRDILVGRQERQHDYDMQAAVLLDRYFHAVLVHSDPSFALLEESIAAGVQIPVPVYYTGFVHSVGGRATERPCIRPGSIIVSAGGGMVGEALLRTAIDAHALVPATARRPLAVVAGPFLPQQAWRRLRVLLSGRPGVHLRRSVPNLAIELAHAAASISQCGYNTAMDLIHSRVPGLVIPFGGDAEDEQLKRARRLEALGVVRVILPTELTPARLAAAMQTLPFFRPSLAALDLNGAEHTAGIVQALSSGTSPRATGRHAGAEQLAV